MAKSTLTARRTILAAGTLAAAGLIGASLTGFAPIDRAQLNAADAIGAVEQVAPGAVSDLTDTSTTKTDVAVADLPGASVSVPVDATKGVEIKPDGHGAGIRVGLPYAAQADDASRSHKNGVVVYDNNNGSSTIPVIHQNGSVQITTVMQDASAPTSYAYPLSLTAGQSLQLAADGGASIVDGSGHIAGTIDAPWAKDAHGKAVDTAYEVHGNTLTQVIHTSADTAFPVVADPTYWWGGKTWVTEKKLNVVKSTVGLSALIGMAVPAALTGFAVGICDNAGKGIWVYWTWAGQVWCTGP